MFFDKFYRFNPVGRKSYNLEIGIVREIISHFFCERDVIVRYNDCVHLSYPLKCNYSSSWFAPVILGDYMYFLDGTKEYTYRVKLQTGDIVKPETKDMVVGKMTADDYKAVFESENE